MMLYNANSFRQLAIVPRDRLRALRRGISPERIRASYDSNTAGEAAPHTDFVSRRDVWRLFGAFSSVRIDVQNFEALSPTVAGRTIVIPRERLLGNVARFLGLDLYIHARK